MTKPDAAVSAMLDREAIRDIVDRYYDAIWRNDIDAVVDLFTEDGGMVTRNGPLAGASPVGREELRAFYITGVKTMTPRPFGHNHVVELHGEDHATGRVYVELRSSVDYAWIAAVIYEDEYVKRDGRWRFRRREARIQNMP